MDETIISRRDVSGESTADSTSLVDSPRIARIVAIAAWFFIVLGIGLRLFRFGMNFPLWGDEAFVAVNLIERGFRELAKPLDYGQICPILFLWIERAIILRLGVHEWSLRLFPLLCAVASVGLFYRVMSRFTKGTPVVLATAILAVSFHPIRHSAEVKPYASDLFVALVLMGLAFDWLRDRSRLRALCLLTLLSPFALALSHPAAFVLGGISLGLALPVARTRSLKTGFVFIAFNFVTLASFLILYKLVTSSHEMVHSYGLRAYWANSFPPVDSPLRLLIWLIDSHTGTMLAYPGGGKNGASTGTLLLCLVAVFVLVRERRGEIAVICLGPFALALVAAFLKRYPYGGEARQMQFLVPAICLLAGIGGARLIDKIKQIHKRMNVYGFVAVVLIVIGVVPLVLDSRHPYRRLYDRQARDFAKGFWSAQEREAEVACLCMDFGVKSARSLNLRTAIFVSNETMYSSRSVLGRGPRFEAVSADRPLRCVLYDETSPDDPRVISWFKEMSARYRFLGRKEVSIASSDYFERPKTEHCYIYEFIPYDERLGAREFARGKRPEGRGERSY